MCLKTAVPAVSQLSAVMVLSTCSVAGLLNASGAWMWQDWKTYLIMLECMSTGLFPSNLQVLQELFMPAAVAAEGPRPAPAPLSAALCMTATRSVERIPDGSACERDNDQEAEPTTRAASAQEVASAQAQLFPALPAVNLRLQRISQDEAQEVVTELQHLSNEWCVMLRSDQLVISKHQCHHCTFPLPCLKSFVCQCPSRLTIRHVMVE